MIKNLQQTQKQFIQRHIRELVEQDLKAEEILQKSLTILDDSSITKQALKDLERSGSLTKTLHQLDIIRLDESLIKVIESQEGLKAPSSQSIVALLDANETITDSFRLLKTRLTVGLAYALWLSIIATAVFSIISLKVLPQFDDIFSGFGAELPGFTRMALDWQSSLFSPGIIGLLFVLLIGYLLVSVQLLSKQRVVYQHNLQSWILTKIPFIKNVINFSKDIDWLSQLKILSSTGLSIKDSLAHISKLPTSLKKHLPDMITELKAAEKIGNIDTEFKYQSHQLNQLAEKIVTNAARNLVGVVMIFVVSYVIFTIFASYLPIFQLGAVI